MVLPYFGELTTKLSNYFEFIEIRTIFKVDNKLDNLVVDSKDKIPKTRQHNVTYQIQCKIKNCRKLYTGRTTQALKKQTKDHFDNHKKDSQERLIEARHQRSKEIYAPKSLT